MQVFIVSNTLYPAKTTTIDGVHSNEINAWKEIEKMYYCDIKLLQQTNNIIESVKIYEFGMTIEYSSAILPSSKKMIKYIISKRYIDVW